MEFKKPTIEGKLSGQIACITGSSYGIGRGVAVELARQGASVVVSGRRQEEIDKTVDEIKAYGGKAEGRVLDVCDKAAIDAFFQEYIKGLGGIDIFVNNAGVTKVENFLDNSQETLEWINNTNWMGAVYCIQNAGRLMAEQKRGGNIVIITSVNAMAALPTQSFYSAIKAGLENLCRGLAWELAAHNIRVNTVAPGATFTGMSAGKSLAEWDEIMHDRVPLKRMGLPEDIAKAVAFVASDDASYMTGSSILVDGGIGLRDDS